MRRLKTSTKPLTQQEKAECYRSILRGKCVANFYASDMWTKHLKPFLESTRKEILAENPFRAGRDIPEIERIALLSAFNGGRIRILDDLNDQLSQWINLATHAQQKLGMEKERSK